MICASDGTGEPAHWQICPICINPAEKTFIYDTAFTIWQYTWGPIADKWIFFSLLPFFHLYADFHTEQNYHPIPWSHLIITFCSFLYNHQFYFKPDMYELLFEVMLCLWIDSQAEAEPKLK